jgi:hypothetical protein
VLLWPPVPTMRTDFGPLNLGELPQRKGELNRRLPVRHLYF